MRVSDEVGDSVDDEMTEDVGVGTEVVERVGKGGRLGCRVWVWVTTCLRMWVTQRRRI